MERTMTMRRSTHLMTLLVALLVLASTACGGATSVQAPPDLAGTTSDADEHDDGQSSSPDEAATPETEEADGAEEFDRSPRRLRPSDACYEARPPSPC
jgi:hypothetical protein